MYDELERAMGGGGRRRGPSPVGWFLLVLGAFVVTGAVGVGLLVREGVTRAREVAERFQVQASAPAAAAQVVERLQAHTALLRAEPGEGMAFLRSLDAADPAGDLVGQWAEVQAGTRSTQGAQVGSGEREGAAHDDAGGSFVLRTDEGEVRIDLRRSEGGGSLVIGADGEVVRFDLARTEDGGFLTIDSDEGQVRFDLTQGEDGGSLVVRTDRDEVLRLGIGLQAAEMPGWVPAAPGMPSTPDPVYSLGSEDGVLGAVSWTESGSPHHVVDFYAERLVDQGFELDAEGRGHGEGLEGSALWARHDASGRIVFVVAHGDEGVTKVLLGYGEER